MASIFTLHVLAVTAASEMKCSLHPMLCVRTADHIEAQAFSVRPPHMLLTALLTPTIIYLYLYVCLLKKKKKQKYIKTPLDRITYFLRQPARKLNIMTLASE